MVTADTAIDGAIPESRFPALSTKIGVSAGLLIPRMVVNDFAELKKELSCNTPVEDMRTIKGHGDTYASIQKTSREPFRDIARPNGSDSL